jgi:uncharacterized membrane protein YraQ (UPF0718 family)
MNGRRGTNMLIPTLVLAVAAIVLVLVGYYRGEAEHLSGLGTAGRMMIQIVPLLVFAFVVAGMVQELIPREALSRWVGGESGMRGILIGTVAGGLAPGGPYVSLPIAAGLLQSGAGIGTMVAFITGWSLWAVGRIPMEIGVLGVRFTAIRILCTFFFPPIAGLIARALFENTR